MRIAGNAPVMRLRAQAIYLAGRRPPALHHRPPSTTHTILALDASAPSQSHLYMVMARLQCSSGVGMESWTPVDTGGEVAARIGKR